MPLSLRDRTLAAIDDAFADQVGKHFAGICLQVDSDGGQKAPADIAHFETALRHLLTAYEGARAIAQKVIPA